MRVAALVVSVLVGPSLLSGCSGGSGGTSIASTPSQKVDMLNKVPLHGADRQRLIEAAQKGQLGSH